MTGRVRRVRVVTDRCIQEPYKTFSLLDVRGESIDFDNDVMLAGSWRPYAPNFDRPSPPRSKGVHIPMIARIPLAWPLVPLVAVHRMNQMQLFDMRSGKVSAWEKCSSDPWEHATIPCTGCRRLACLACASTALPCHLLPSHGCRPPQFLDCPLFLGSVPTPRSLSAPYRGASSSQRIRLRSPAREARAAGRLCAMQSAAHATSTLPSTSTAARTWVASLRCAPPPFMQYT